jgi:hypothetical protein
MFPTPHAGGINTPGVSTSWEGDDENLLQDAFSKQPVTPGFLSSSANDPPPSTTSKYLSGHNANTPRVFFKDQLTETFDFQNGSRDVSNETPFTNMLSMTPCRSKAVTGSGPHRIRGNAMAEERDNLLSTAILDTPRSPKVGNIQDIDQSLHHIDACIKSPLNFGSPNMKESPMRR